LLKKSPHQPVKTRPNDNGLEEMPKKGVFSRLKTRKPCKLTAGWRQVNCPIISIDFTKSDFELLFNYLIFHFMYNSGYELTKSFFFTKNHGQ
jgi:hypothetical protein